VLAAALLLASFASAGSDREPLRFVDLEGRAVVLGPPAEGEALVVHYWATWCPTCGPELAALAAAAGACEGTRVRVVAVDVGEPAARVRRFLAERSLALPVALDARGRTWRRAGGRELPANLVWTEHGRELSFGPSDEAAWRDRLAALGCTGAAPDR
jgi:peroxiredoxin